MSHPSTQPRNSSGQPDPRALISAYLDGVLNDEQFEHLQQWIMSDRENARQFARLSMLQEDIIARLRRDDVAEFLKDGSRADFVFSELVLEAVAEDQAANAKRAAQKAEEVAKEQALEYERQESMARILAMTRKNTEPPVRHYVIPTPLFYGSIAAVIAIAAAIIWPMFEQTPVAVNKPVPVATLVDDAQVEWVGLETPIAIDEKMIPGQYSLEKGIAKLRFNNGAIVTIEAPATFDLMDDDLAKLISGRIVGYCQPGSEGFTVITPNTRVVDLGTEFGIDVTADGSVALEQVHVFDGSVRATAVSKANAIKPLTLVEGNAAVVRKDLAGLTMDETEADDTLFVKARSGLIQSDDFRNPSFEVQSVRRSSEFKWPDEDKGVYQIGRKYFREIEGWKSSRLEVIESADGPEVPWLLGVQIAPFRQSEAGGTRRRPRDGEQVLTMVPGRDRKNRVWIYQSIGQIGFEDVGTTLTANIYTAARDKHTLPTTAGGTITIAFATDVTDLSPGNGLGEIETSDPLFMDDAPQILNTTYKIEKSHIGKEVFLVVMAHDPNSQAVGNAATGYFADDVKLNISKPKRKN